MLPSPSLCVRTIRQQGHRHSVFIVLQMEQQTGECNDGTQWDLWGSWTLVQLAQHWQSVSFLNTFISDCPHSFILTNVGWDKLCTPISVPTPALCLLPPKWLHVPCAPQGTAAPTYLLAARCWVLLIMAQLHLLLDAAFL